MSGFKIFYNITQFTLTHHCLMYSKYIIQMFKKMDNNLTIYTHFQLNNFTPPIWIALFLKWVTIFPYLFVHICLYTWLFVIFKYSSIPTLYWSPQDHSIYWLFPLSSPSPWPRHSPRAWCNTCNTCTNWKCSRSGSWGCIRCGTWNKTP